MVLSRKHINYNSWDVMEVCNININIVVLHYLHTFADHDCTSLKIVSSTFSC